MEVMLKMRIKELFDFISPRTKDGLSDLGDMNLWLKYLYLNPEHKIQIWGQTIKMDSNFNLIYVLKSLQPDGTWTENFERSICANSLTYKELLDITQELKQDKKVWKEIEFAVLSCDVINKPRK